MLQPNFGQQSGKKLLLKTRFSYVKSVLFDEESYYAKKGGKITYLTRKYFKNVPLWNNF